MTDEGDAFFITEEEAGERLDKVLAARLHRIGSRTYFQSLIEDGKVLLNGNPVKKRIKPKVGDEIEVEFACTPELTLKAENIPLDIIYEDEYLLVVNKPAGMVVHPACGHWSGTFVNALLYHCQDLLRSNGEGNSSISHRPGIVHRLDKDTSGLLIAAKTASTHQRLIDMFIGREIFKEYLAICSGNPREGIIDAPIGRHPVHRKMMSVVNDGGRSALTHFKTLSFNDKISLVSVVITTGRTHQIRVHMRHHGNAVLGDALYGIPSLNAKYGVDRQMLHAYRLKFKHPILLNMMEFEAPIPKDLQKIIDII